jgi:hypothetical protein
MGFSLAELRKGAPGSGIDVAPAIDVLSLLGDPDVEAAANKTYKPAGQAEEAEAGR